MGSPTSGVLVGALAPFRGFAFLVVRPRLWPALLVPVLLVGAAILGAGWIAWNLVPFWFAAWIWAPPGPGPIGAMWGVAALLSVMLGFGLFTVVGVSLARILAIPFYDRVSEKVEAEVAPGNTPPLSGGEYVSEMLRATGHSLLALGAWLVVMAGISLLALVPVLDVIAPILGFAATALFLARDLADFALARRRWTFAEKARYLQDRWPGFLAFGSVTLLLLGLPLIDLLALPAAVVGATLLITEDP